MSIDEFYDDEPHEGIKYNVQNDGTVEVSNEQITIDDVKENEKQIESESSENNSVVTVDVVNPLDDEDQLDDDDFSINR